MSTSTVNAPPKDSLTPHDGTAAETPSGELSELVDVVDWCTEVKDKPQTEWLTLLNLDEPRERLQCLNPSSRFIKRSMDVCVAIVALILLSPVMLLTALLVKLTSPGPAIFRQERVGLNRRSGKQQLMRRAAMGRPGCAERRGGQDRRKTPSYGRPFVLYKFRSMRDDAEKNGPQFATKSDPRVTSIGRFLRKTRLDELPQLWNVLRGDMSLVGPRPERPEFIRDLSEEIPDYVHRLGLKPGLTGVAQVVNGYDNDIEGFRRKVTLDLLYLQNCCLWNDIKILFRTVGVVLTGKGAL